MASKVIELGKMRGKREPNPFRGHSAQVQRFIMPASERMRIEMEGTRAQRRDLKRLEAKENMRFGKHIYLEEKRMKMLVKQVNNPIFIGTIHKLDQCSKYPSAQVAWNVMKLVKACHELVREQRDFYQKMTKDHAELDEKGEVKLNDKNQIVYKSPADEETHGKKFEEYMNMEVELRARQLDLNEISAANLSPVELEAIEPLIDPASVIS